jgi:RNA polymerase sigma factor (sigma-70 family)
MTDWEGILRRDGPAVWRYVYRLLGRREEAEDCYQETFLAALSAFKRGPIASERAFLLRLATARAIDKLRSRYRRAGREQSADWSTLGLADGSPAPAQSAEASELSARLRDALATLPPNQADVFCLHCLEGWSYQEIAAELELSESNVGVLIHRARAKLKVLLASLDPEQARKREATG